MSKLALVWLCLGLAGCATTSRVTQNLSLGMNTDEVLRKTGIPFSKNASRDARGDIIEEWIYRETTWDDAGWTWDRTIINTVVKFRNGKVESFGKEGERYKTKNPMGASVNVDATTHQEPSTIHQINPEPSSLRPTQPRPPSPRPAHSERLVR